jgi:hypothetical protein
MNPAVILGVARSALARSAPSFLALVLAPPILAAQSVRLNGPLVQPGSGDVTDFAISRSGASVVFRADQAEDGVFELFAAPRDGGSSAVRLHAPLVGGARDVLSFAPAAHGARNACSDRLVA